MIDRHGERKDRRICDLVPPFEGTEAVVRRVWSDVSAAPDNNPREAPRYLHPSIQSLSPDRGFWLVPDGLRQATMAFTSSKIRLFPGTAPGAGQRATAGSILPKLHCLAI